MTTLRRIGRALARCSRWIASALIGSGATRVGGQRMAADAVRRQFPPEELANHEDDESD